MNSTKRHKYTLTSILKLKLKLNLRYEFANAENTLLIGLGKSLITVMAYKVALGGDMCVRWVRFRFFYGGAGFSTLARHSCRLR